MLEAMINGKHLGRLDLHVVRNSLAFVDRGERAMVETMLADHRRQLTDYDKRLGETDPAAMRDYYDGQAQADRPGDRARDRAAQAPAARRSPAAGSRTGSSRSIRRRPTRPASPSWSTATTARPPGGRQRASRPGSGTRRSGTAPPRPPRPPPGPPPHRATSAPAPAGPVTRPRSRSGRRPNTRARCRRWPASGATAIRRVSAATSRGTCRGAGRWRPRRRSPPWPGSAARRATGLGGLTSRRSTSGSRPPAPSPRPSAGAATPRT